MAVGALLALTGRPALAVVWAVLCLVDALPVLAGSVLRSTGAFSLAWLAGAALRLPAAFLLSLVFASNERVTQGLPLAYLGSLLISAAVAAVVIRSAEPAAPTGSEAIIRAHKGVTAR